jgi:hypothetical protein
LSHIVHVQIQTKLRDREAVRAACRRLSLPEPVHGTAALFSASATLQPTGHLYGNQFLRTAYWHR